MFSAGNTWDKPSTDWQYFRVRYCSFCEYWQYAIVRYCTLLRVYSQYIRFCTFILPELREFRGLILQLLPVLAVHWEDTASIGNILGLCTADILLPWLCAVLFLTATAVVLSYCEYSHYQSIYSQCSQYTPIMTYTEMNICAHCCAGLCGG